MTAPRAGTKKRKQPAQDRYSRIVVKAGTTLLTDGAGGLDLPTMEGLVGQMAQLHRDGVDVIFVTSGAVAAGRHVLDTIRDSRDVPFRQVLAAAGQGRLMHSYEHLFGEHEITVAQALLTRKDLQDRLGYLNVRNTLLALLELRVIPIVNENDVVSIDELAGEVFGDNDNLSAMVANLVDADLLALLGQVEGLFTADPHVDPSATLIPIVDRLGDVEALGGRSWDGQGQGGMTTKIEAAKMAMASGIHVAIAGGRQPEVLTRLASGERIGTFFPATGSKMESRKRWMLSGVSTKGEIVIDAGASSAITERNRSLLPAGVKEVNGSFARGDIVSISSLSNGQVAAGIANYASDELAHIKGQRSDRIEELLGHDFGDEAVHRNNMVVL